ncbi:heterokaryon incompatibility protein-domain-containing protein [Lophiotrema nucula]|uniref:Heterokaryon incompatibility protein-domain-containing protein n=1 Tax=Lophiotrema nucula TaxID=690887 RepID=A0A6A5ZH63_9PLEO|nr:heterokaryon incompatibility protein-domain-containing protein [Lophiotrema nucula]
MTYRHTLGITPRCNHFVLRWIVGCILCNIIWEEYRRKEVEFEEEGFSIGYAIYCDHNIFPCEINFRIAIGDTYGDFKKYGAKVMITNTPEENVEIEERYDRSLDVNIPMHFEVKTIPSKTEFRKQGLNVQLSVDGLFPLDTSTGSDRTLMLARAWLRACCDGHDACARHIGPSEQLLPKRVLDLGATHDGKGTIQLYESASQEPGSYATLTHRWGDVKPLEFTRNNAEHLKHGFDVSELPKTFQDAVYIAGALSIRYIWIDSMCIMQDSQRDWVEQSALMAEIYKNATVNIAATGARDSSMGIFSERNTRAVSPARVRLYWEGQASMGIERHQGKDCLLIPSSMCESQIESSALSQRGWVFQERLLSPRILHFTSTQVFWECHSSNACETIPTGRPFVGVQGLPYKMFLDRARRREIQPYEGRVLSNPPKEDKDMRPLVRIEPKAALYESWGHLVGQYSRCQFTKPTDKLVALKGAAAEMTHALEGRDVYLAGHWYNNLAWEILWMAGEEVAPGQIKLYSTTRPREERLAPTWSWASINGPVHSFDSHLASENGAIAGCSEDSKTLITILLTDVLGPIQDRGPASGTVRDQTPETDSMALAQAVESLAIEDTLDAQSQSLAYLNQNCAYINLVGHVFDATIWPLSRPTENGQIDQDIHGWVVVFGEREKTGDSDHSDNAGREGWKACKFGARLFPDDWEDCSQRIIPWGGEDRGIRLVALPVFWTTVGKMYGLLLEEVDDPKIVMDGRTGTYGQKPADLPPSFERVGIFIGENMLESDGGWGDASYFSSRDKASIRLY